MRTHTHTHIQLGWLVCPQTSDFSTSSHCQRFCSPFYLCVFFFCPLPPPLLSFVASVSPVYFCPSVKSSHYVSLPPIGERRRRPRWEITAAQLYSGHGQACLQGKQRCACKDHNHSTLDRVSALMAAAQICFDVVFWVCNLRAISSWHAKECFLFNHVCKSRRQPSDLDRQ